jgi:hypothetical protein
MYRNKIDNSVEDSFQAFLVEGAEFTKNEEYPIIENRMIPTIPPKRIMPFSKAIHYQGNLSDVYVCFFSPDLTFERVRRSPRRYLPFFRRCAGVIGFDFSVHSDMPLVKQKSQMNDNLSLTFFYGNNGCPVIPNARWGIDETADEFLSAIPKRSIVAIGLHGFSKRNWQKAEWHCFLEKLIESREPIGIIVYGNPNETIFGPFKGKCDFFFYEPWISQRRRKGGNPDVD